MKFLRAHSYRHFRTYHNLSARRAWLAAVVHTHGLLDQMADMPFIAREVRMMTPHQLNEFARRAMALMGK